jgi:hypothetical protein
MQIIYYSLVNREDSRYEWQWVQSIRSLRLYNSRLTVWLFVFGHVSELIRREASRHGVVLFGMGKYEDWLQTQQRWGLIFSRYPVLHKFLVLTEVDTSVLRQALYLDCDTFFFGDPERLFCPTAPCHWLSREEIGSRVSPYGYDPANINEELLGRIVATEKLRWVFPFNTGVCLLGSGIWNTFRQLRNTYFDFVWRLTVGREHFRRDSLERDDIGTAVIRQARGRDIARALPYPSQNFWILEEFATWLTLGRVPNLSQRMFFREHVVQGDEYIDAVRRKRYPILAHYFSYLEKDFFKDVKPLDGSERRSWSNIPRRRC